MGVSPVKMANKTIDQPVYQENEDENESEQSEQASVRIPENIDIKEAPQV